MSGDEYWPSIVPFVPQNSTSRAPRRHVLATQGVDPLVVYGLATILLVEDTLDDERLALRALQRLGGALMVKVARDGEAALRALGLDGEAPRRAPDLVLCDLKLPKVSGDEVLRRARGSERLREVPFVVFSSSDEPTDVDRCAALGASEYAVKPVDYDSYGERVRRIVERHLPAAAREPRTTVSA